MRAKFLYLFLSIIVAFQFNNKAFCNVFQKGIESYRNDNYKQAENYLRQAMKEDFNDPSIRYYLAMTLVKNKKYKEAKYHYKAILRKSSDPKLLKMADIGLSLIDKTHKKGEYNRSNSYNVSHVELPMSNDHNIIVRDLVINGIKVKPLYILDTGASKVTITTKLAEQLGIDYKNAPTIRTQTANGIVSVPVITLNSVKVKGLEAKNVSATVQDIDNTGILGGLLGLSYLNNFKVIMDKSKNTVILKR